METINKTLSLLLCVCVESFFFFEVINYNKQNHFFVNNFYTKSFLFNDDRLSGFIRLLISNSKTY